MNATPVTGGEKHRRPKQIVCMSVCTGSTIIRSTTVLYLAPFRVQNTIDTGRVGSAFPRQLEEQKRFEKLRLTVMQTTQIFQSKICQQYLLDGVVLWLQQRRCQSLKQEPKMCVRVRAKHHKCCSIFTRSHVTCPSGSSARYQARMAGWLLKWSICAVKLASVAASLSAFSNAVSWKLTC